MDDNRTLKEALVAGRRLPKQKSWSFQLEAQLRDVSVNVPTTDGHSHRCFSIQSAQSAHIAQLSSNTSSRAATLSSSVHNKSPSDLTSIINQDWGDSKLVLIVFFIGASNTQQIQYRHKAKTVEGSWAPFIQ